MKFYIIPATPDDTDEIAEIESRCFSDPWSTATIKSTIENEIYDVYKAVDEKEKILGYVFLCAIQDEAEIENIAVDHDYRRQGIARALLDRAINHVSTRGARTIYLEVRESNDTAQKLYESAGFERNGIRPNYYTRPRENALIMHKIVDLQESGNNEEN